MKFEIKGTELLRILSNANLWVDETPVYLAWSVSQLSIYATDDYIAMNDSAEVTPVGDGGICAGDMVLHTDDFDILLAAAREIKSKPLTVDMTPVGLVIPYAVERDDKNKIILSEGSHFLKDMIGDDVGWVDEFSRCLTQDQETEWMNPGFAIRAERWLKFCRVKPVEKDAPIDVKFLPRNLAAIKIGSTFSAMVRLLDRDIAKEAIPNKDMMW